MKRLEDERIIAEKRRINSNAFGICFMALWGIILYRQYILQQHVTEYMDIFLLTIGISIYVTIYNVFEGLYLTYRNKKARMKVVLIGALTGAIAFTAVQFAVTGFEFRRPADILKLVFPAVIFIINWIVGQSLLLSLSEKRGDRQAKGE